MTAGILPKDQNFISAIGGTSSLTDTASSIRSFQYDPTTRGLTVHVVGMDAITISLPTGASPSTKQDTQTTLLQGIAGFLPSAYDYFIYTSGSTTDTFVFKTGGSGGTTVSTITLTYTDSTKKTLSTGEKT